MVVGISGTNSGAAPKRASIGCRARRGRGQSGAALVEFAIILPLFMTLVLGMFTGGLAYNQNLSLSHAAREGTRYGATLSKAPPSGLSAANWTAAVSARAVEAAAGDLSLGTTGHFVCVALVKPDGTNFGSPAYAATFGDSSAASAGGFNPATGCYTDNLSGSLRVHVVVGRPGRIETLFFARTLTLTGRGTARYEGA